MSHPVPQWHVNVIKDIHKETGYFEVPVTPWVFQHKPSWPTVATYF